MQTVAATRYVTALREGGSVPALVEASDGCLWVIRFRGAAQGAKAFIAELIGGGIGRALGLPVPEETGTKSFGKSAHPRSRRAAF